MKIIWSGVHERRKALNVLALSVASVIRREEGYAEGITVDVLGVGGQTKRWARLVKRLGLTDCFIWHGWLTKDRAQEVVAGSDIFVITSLHDLTSTVLLEALSLGKPVICLDHCGFSDVVDETCGIKIPVGEPKEVIEGFAAAIRQLMDPSLREHLSQGALSRASEYVWSKKRAILANWLKPEWKKIVVGCYACSPYRGSEPGMGWNYLRAVAEGREVWAIVEKEKWEKDIEKFLAGHPDEMKSVHWVFIRKRRARILRKLWPPSYYWYYRLWQVRAYQIALGLHRAIGFDAAYQMNMVTFREPGYLWKLPIPFIWGPVGGLGYTDRRLLGLMGLLGAVEYAVRNTINWLHCHLMLRSRIAAVKAAATGTLIAATSENRREMQKLWGVDAKVLCEIGVDG